MATATELRTLGNQKMKQNNYATALVLYTNAINKDPSSAALYCNRSAAYMKLDCMSEAAVDLKRSLELNPNYIPSLCRLGFLTLYEGNPIASLENYVKAVHLISQRPNQLERFKSQLKEAVRLAEERARQQGYPQSYIDNIIPDQARIALDSFRSLPRTARTVNNEPTNGINLPGERGTARVVPIAVASGVPASNITGTNRGFMDVMDRVFSDLPNFITTNIQTAQNPVQNNTNTQTTITANTSAANNNNNSSSAVPSTDHAATPEPQDSEMDEDPDVGIDDIFDSASIPNNVTSDSNHVNANTNPNLTNSVPTSGVAGNQNFIHRFFNGVAGNNTNNAADAGANPQESEAARLARQHHQTATQFAANIARSAHQFATAQASGNNTGAHFAEALQRNFVSMLNPNGTNGNTVIINTVGPDGQTHTFSSVSNNDNTSGTNTTHTTNPTSDNDSSNTAHNSNTGDHEADQEMLDDNLNLD